MMSQFSLTFILIVFLISSSGSSDSSTTDPRKFDSCDMNKVCYVVGSCRGMKDGYDQLIRVPKGKKINDGCIAGLIAKQYKKDIVMVHFWSSGDENTTQIILTVGKNNTIECTTRVGDAFLCQNEINIDSSAEGIQLKSGDNSSTTRESLMVSLHDLFQQCPYGEVELKDDCDNGKKCKKPMFDEDELHVSCRKEDGQLEVLQDKKWMLADSFSCINDQWTVEEKGSPVNVTSPQLRCSKTAISPKPKIQPTPAAAHSDDKNLGAFDGMNYALVAVLPLIALRG